MSKQILKLFILFLLLNLLLFNKIYSSPIDTSIINLKINDLGYIPKEEINLIDKMISQKKFSKALKYLKKASKKYGKDNQVITTYYGLVAYRQGKLSEAEGYWLNACSRGETFYAPFYNLGILYFKTKDFEKSKKYFEKALGLRADNKYAIEKNLFVIYRELGDYGKSEVFLRSLRDRMKSWEYNKEMGILCYMQDKPQALNYFLSSHKENSNDAWVSFYLSQLYMDSDYKKSMEFINNAIKIKSNEMFLYQKMYILYLQGTKDDVRSFIKTITLKNLRSRSLLLLLTDLSIKYSDEKLLKQLIVILKKNNFFDNIAINNIAAYFFNKKEYKKANKYFKLSLKTLNNSHDKVSILSELAKSYYAIDSLKISEKYFKEILSIEENAMAYYYLSLISIKYNELKNAKINIKKAIDHDPSNDDYGMLLDLLDNKKNVVFDDKSFLKKDIKKAILYFYIKGEYKKVLEYSKNVKDEKLVYYKVKSLFFLKKYNLAYNELKKIKKDSIYYQILGDINFKLKNYQLAVINYKKAGNSKDLYYYIGLSYFKLNKYNNALKYLLVLKKDYRAVALIGNIYATKGNLKKAKYYWKYANDLTNIKNNYDIKRNLALSDFYLKNYKSALKKFINIKKIYVDSEKINLDIANCYFMLKDYDNAIHFLKQVPNINQKYFNLGLIYAIKKDLKKADLQLLKIRNDSLKWKLDYYISYYKKNFSRVILLSKKVEKNNDDYLLLAKSYNSISEYGKAIKTLNKLENSTNENNEIFREKIYSYSGIGDYKRAIRILSFFKKNHDDSLNMIYLYFKDKQFSKTYELMNNNNEYKLENLSVYYNVLINLKKYDEIFDFIKKNKRLKKDPISLVALSIYYNSKKDYKKMESCLNEARMIDSDVEEKYRNLFKLVKNFHEYKSLNKLRQQKYKVHRDSIKLYNRLVDVFNHGLVNQNSGEIDSALIKYKFVYEKGFKRVELFNNMISIFFIKKNYIKAAKYIDLALKLYPKNLYINYNKGVYFYNIGKKDSASFILKKIRNDFRPAKDLYDSIKGELNEK